MFFVFYLFYFVFAKLPAQLCELTGKGCIIIFILYHHLKTAQNTLIYLMLQFYRARKSTGQLSFYFLFQNLLNRFCGDKQGYFYSLILVIYVTKLLSYISKQDYSSLVYQ